MGYREDPDWLRQWREDGGDRELAFVPGVAPGKRTLTMNLPARPVEPSSAASPPVQMKGDPAAEARRQENTAITEQWMTVAIRPDLHVGPRMNGRFEGAGHERAAHEVLMGGGKDPGEEAPVAAMPVPEDNAVAAPSASEARAADAAQGMGKPVATGEPGATGESTVPEESAAESAAAPMERVASEVLSASGQSAAESVLASSTVHTAIYGTSAPTTVMGGSKPSMGGGERTAYSVVTPGGSPTLGSHENTCLPSTSSAVLAWDMVEEGDSWRPDCKSLTLVGQVNVKPWPNKPSSEEVPNTPNPVDGGNINNTKGSDNHWKAAIDDMSDYNKAGGGAGPHWHDTEASKAHEWAHWNIDYIKDSVMSGAGGNWPEVNMKIDALRVEKSAYASATAARAALKPKVDALLSQWRSKVISRWNAIPDSPGAAGGAGYAAGQKVLDKHIAAIESYRKSKKWT